MNQYRCYFLSPRNSIVGLEVIECESDEQACAKARQLISTRGHRAAEVWHGARRVCSVERETA
jgi:hypothetical protein